MRITDALKAWTQRVKRDGVTLWFAVRYDQTPWYAKALGVFVAAYALSPIDLVPDFVPILGYVDDVLLLPALIWLAIRLLPSSVLTECRARADEWMRLQKAKPISRLGTVIVALLWAGMAVFVLSWWLA